MNRIRTVLLSLFVAALASATTAGEVRKSKIRVLVISTIRNLERPAVGRLSTMGCEVSVSHIAKVNWDSLTGYDVILLPTAWANKVEPYNIFQEMAPRFLAYVEQGGGLLVCQPNPNELPGRICTPKLLPWPVTFHTFYDMKDAQRINLYHKHYITEDIKPEELPFPADKMSAIDREHWQVLVMGARSESASLLTGEYGKGRIVIQTGNENPSSLEPFSQRIFERMITWAAGREPQRFRKNAKDK